MTRRAKVAPPVPRPGSSSHSSRRPCSMPWPSWFWHDRDDGTAGMQAFTLTDAEFARVQALARTAMGIHLPLSKKALVVGRWSRRLLHYGLHSFREYLELIGTAAQREELQTALDLLTTNETHFFREKQHFDFLQRELL